MTRTSRTHRLAYPLAFFCGIGVLTTPGPSWAGAIFGLATVLAAVVLVKPVDRPPIVTTDDTRARRLHPSNCDAFDWPESHDGIPSREDR